MKFRFISKICATNTNTNTRANFIRSLEMNRYENLVIFILYQQRLFEISLVSDYIVCLAIETFRNFALNTVKIGRYHIYVAVQMYYENINPTKTSNSIQTKSIVLKTIGKNMKSIDIQYKMNRKQLSSIQILLVNSAHI